MGNEYENAVIWLLRGKFERGDARESAHAEYLLNAIKAIPQGNIPTDLTVKIDPNKFQEENRTVVDLADETAAIADGFVLSVKSAKHPALSANPSTPRTYAKPGFPNRVVTNAVEEKAAVDAGFRLVP